MYAVKTDRTTGQSAIIDTKSLPPNTVANFVKTIGEARKELDFRNDILLCGVITLCLYLDQNRWDF